jgi:hypothetical protein
MCTDRTISRLSCRLKVSRRHLNVQVEALLAWLVDHGVITDELKPKAAEIA